VTGSTPFAERFSAVAYDRGVSDLLGFLLHYFQGGRTKLVAVFLLDMLLSSITGVGLLMILPLLGLLGIGAAAGENPVWREVQSALDGVGVGLTLETGLAFFVAVIGLRAVLTWRRDTWQVELEQRFQLALRVGLYESLANTALDFLQQLRTSDFIQSTQTEIRRAQQAANVLLRLVSQLLNLGAYLAVAVILSPEMSLFALACGALGAIVLVPLMRRTHALSRQQIGIRNRMLSNLIEHIQGIRTARTLGLAERFIADFRARCEQAAAGSNELRRLSAKSSLVFDLVAVVILATFVYVGISLFEVEAGLFVVLLIIFIRVFPSIGEFQTLAHEFIGLIPSFRHYRDLLTELERHKETEVVAPRGRAPRLESALELKNLSFRYGTAHAPVLRDACMVIERGRLTALGGHSGAGKSTLADIVTGLLSPHSGEILLDGHPLDDHERMLWRRATSVVPQECFLFDDSIRGNLLCVKPDATEAELWDVLDAVNCRTFVESRPSGLDSPVGERGALLSGGERQRLCIGRALLRDPQLLVLDEPTNNLDRDSERAVLDLLLSLKARTTLLVISHDESLLRIADRVYRLEDGGIVIDSRVTTAD
jgi:ATP-binding cassette subfamily C protein